jgi:hypothetical protein
LSNVVTVVQRFCSGPHRSTGFVQDPETGWWVCDGCGLPTRQSYVARAARGEPPLPEEIWNTHYVPAYAP